MASLPEYVATHAHWTDDLAPLTWSTVVPVSEWCVHLCHQNRRHSVSKTGNDLAKGRQVLKHCCVCACVSALWSLLWKPLQLKSYTPDTFPIRGWFLWWNNCCHLASVHFQCDILFPQSDSSSRAIANISVLFLFLALFLFFCILEPRSSFVERDTFANVEF